MASKARKERKAANRNSNALGGQGNPPDAELVATIGLAVRNGATGDNWHFQRNMPDKNSQAQISQALCLAGLGAQEELRRFAKELCEECPEWLHTMWRAVGRSQFLFSRILTLIKTARPVSGVDKVKDHFAQVHPRILREDQLASARMVWKMHEKLSANRQRRVLDQGRDTVNRHQANLPVVFNPDLPEMGFSDPDEHPDRYFRLCFHVLQFLRTKINSWLGENDPDNTNLREAVRAYEGQVDALALDVVRSYATLKIRLLHRPEQIFELSLDPVNEPRVRTLSDLTRAICYNFRFTAAYSITRVDHVPNDYGANVKAEPIKDDDDFAELKRDHCDHTIHLRVDYTIDRHLDPEGIKRCRGWYPAQHEFFDLERRFPVANERRILTQEEQDECFDEINTMHQGCVRETTAPPGALNPPAPESAGKAYKKIATASVQDYHEFGDIDALDEDTMEAIQGQSQLPGRENYDDLRLVIPRLHILLTRNDERAGPSPSIIYRLPPGRNQDRPKYLLGSQQTALAFMLESDRDRGGGMIGDEAGVGKTVMIIMMIIATRHYKTHVHRTAIVKPTLVVVPTSLVKQTVQILHDELPDTFLVWRYGNRQQLFSGERKIKVDFRPGNQAFSPYGGSDVGQHIIVMSYEALPFLDKQVPSLEGLFERVICDEAHMMRFAETTKRGQMLLSTQADFRWLLTGSPFPNSVLDARGYIAFLEHPRFRTPCTDYANQIDVNRRNSIDPKDRVLFTKLPKEVQEMGIVDTSDETMEARREELECTISGAPFGGEDIFATTTRDPKARLRCHTVAAFNYYILKHIIYFFSVAEATPQDVQKLITGLRRLAILVNDFCLRRRHTSTYIDLQGNTRRISRALPAMQNRRVELTLNEEEKAYHDAVAVKVGKVEVFPFDGQSITQLEARPALFLEDWDEWEEDADAPSRPMPETATATFSRMTGVASQPASYDMRFRDTRLWQKGFRKRSLSHLVWEWHLVGVNGLAEVEMPFAVGNRAVVRSFAKVGPKYRQAAIDVRRITSQAGPRNKVIIYTQNPVSAEWLHKWFLFLGFGCLLVSSLEDSDVRWDKIMDEFNGDGNEVQVLIMPMTLRILGMNLDRRCKTVILFEQPFNVGTMYQAIMRIRRGTQTEPQMVIRYYMPETFMAVIERRLSQKQWAVAMLCAGHLRNRFLQAENADDIARLMRLASVIVAHDLGATKEIPLPPLDRLE